MRLPEYIKHLSRRDAVGFRKQLVNALNISKPYARHLCNGRNKLPSKYAIAVEKLTSGAVSRFDSAPEHYPETEYEDCYARVRKNITADMD
jgi:DNA-binding transcriptional regulator YdaS (Cro superfamily)